MRVLHRCAALAVLLGSLAARADEETPVKPLRPCTIRSATRGSFFDLNPVIKKAPEGELPEDADPPTSYTARGYDYPANFTLNICAGVVERPGVMKDIDTDLWSNVSAYYTLNNVHYAMGLQNTELVLRGRKLVLNYTGGSICQEPSSSGRITRRYLGRAKLSSHDLSTREEYDAEQYNPYRDEYWDYEREGTEPKDEVDDDEDNSVEEEETKETSGDDKNPEGLRRKSTIISLLCEKDPLVQTPTMSFISASPDECTYFFEMRTHAACSVIEAEVQSLGPSGVFGVIAFIAFAVYIAGGCFYQRNVQNQRGWRQMPNYSLWAGIFNFVMDRILSVTSCCMKLLHGRRGYSRVSPYSNGRARGMLADDENRLIDQLDEEWED